MNFSKLFSLLIAVLAVLTGCGENKRSTGKLVFGTCADYAPFEFYKDGKISGFDIDLMTEIARRLNRQVEFKDLAFDAIIGELPTKRIDGAISALSPTDERRKSVDFTKEYIQEKHVLVCKSTSLVETAADLVEATIGVQSGTIHEFYAKAIFDRNVSIKIKSLGKIPDLIQDMDARRISAIIMGAAEANAIRQSQGNIKIVPLPGEMGGYAIALPKGSLLTEKINTALDEMEKDGTLYKLKEFWLNKS